jgi:protein-S-isoprenylcysteine O-methyltransferase Ste14
MMVGAVVAIVASQSAPAAAIRPAAVAAWIGLGIFWCGIALRLWSFRTLGRYFTVTVQTSGDQPVITSGPYRAIRHPSYAGILLALRWLATDGGSDAGSVLRRGSLLGPYYQRSPLNMSSSGTEAPVVS